MNENSNSVQFLKVRFGSIPFNLMHGLQRLVLLHTSEAKIKWREMGFSAWLVSWFDFSFGGLFVCLFSSKIFGLSLSREFS